MPGSAQRTKTPGLWPGVRFVRSQVKLGILQIRGGLLSALGHHFIGETLTFVEGAHTGALNRADVHEDVTRAVARRDESETLLRIEELDGTCGHDGFSLR